METVNMYLLYAIIFAFLYYVISIFKYGRDKSFRYIEKITVEDMENIKGKNIYYSKNYGMFEITWLLTIFILLLFHAFQDGLAESGELKAMLFSFIFFFLAFIRSFFLLNLKVRIIDSTLYVQKGLKEISYDLDKLTHVEILQYHIMFRVDNKPWIYYLPVGLSNSHVIYKLMKELLDERKKNDA